LPTPTRAVFFPLFAGFGGIRTESLGTMRASARVARVSSFPRPNTLRPPSPKGKLWRCGLFPQRFRVFGQTAIGISFPPHSPTPCGGFAFPPFCFRSFSLALTRPKGRRRNTAPLPKGGMSGLPPYISNRFVLCRITSGRRNFFPLLLRLFEICGGDRADPHAVPFPYTG